MKADNPLALILYCIDKGYQRYHSNPFYKSKDGEVNWGKILNVAEKNKLSYILSQRVIEEGHSSNPVFYKALAKGRENISKLRRTLNFVFTLFKQLGKEFIIIKLYRGHPHITQDIDIMVKEKDFYDITQAFKTQGMVNLSETTRLKAIKNLQYRKYEAVFWKEGLLQIELYANFSWARLPTLDSSLIWESPRMVDISGIRCPIPNYEADILLLLNHALFKDGSITLLDFLYINWLLKKNINFRKLLHQAEKYGWDSPLLALTSTLRNLYQAIYQSEFVSNDTKFPYPIPLHLISYSVWKLLATSRARGDKIHPFTIPGYGLFFALTIKDRLMKIHDR